MKNLILLIFSLCAIFGILGFEIGKRDLSSRIQKAEEIRDSLYIEKGRLYHALILKEGPQFDSLITIIGREN